VYKAIIGFFISPVKVTKQFREDAAKKDYWPNVGAQINQSHHWTQFKCPIGNIPSRLPGCESSREASSFQTKARRMPKTSLTLADKEGSLY
jgi:hypothetical protein